MPEGGLPWSEFAHQKFGGEANAKAALAHVAGAGEPEGVRFDFDRVASTPNTVEAHRGLQWETKDALFRACFTEGGNLKDRKQLVGLASGVGLDVGEVRGCLEDGDAGDEILASQEAPRRLGIVACPSTSSTAAGHSGVPRRRRCSSTRSTQPGARGSPRPGGPHRYEEGV
jgi:predicted DsbA family dithiol-disulfide isomerase